MEKRQLLLELLKDNFESETKKAILLWMAFCFTFGYSSQIPTPLLPLNRNALVDY